MIRHPDATSPVVVSAQSEAFMLHGTHPLIEMLRRRADGESAGIYAACTAHPLVLKAALLHAVEIGQPFLIEATANQVNQDGGYTGMTPMAFREFVEALAKDAGCPSHLYMLGGDHLGPLVWRSMSAEEAMEKAMEKAEALVRAYVMAGFGKIHLDTSMRLGDDPATGPLSAELIATRGARLCRAAEDAWLVLHETVPDAPAPCHVIGSEVPVPGGGLGKTDLTVTRPECFEETVFLYEKAFAKAGLTDAWSRTLAVVIQPGVEFDDDSLHVYCHEKTEGLRNALHRHPGLVLEGHSTDYQPAWALRNLVQDGVAILKVGPALTFHLREALFALEHMERELLWNCPAVNRSQFGEVLEAVMLREPENWNRHCHGTDQQLRTSRRFGLSDRVRYYFPISEVAIAIEKLFANLRAQPPTLGLLHQYLPAQATLVMQHKLENDPEMLVINRIQAVLNEYAQAAGWRNGK